MTPAPKAAAPPHDDLVEIATPDTIWRFERSFLESNWTCIWGKGCLGILTEPAEHLNQGCCSVGAELDGPDEAMFVSAMAAMIPEELFQFHEQANTDGVFSDDRRLATRVVDDACIFLNRPGFEAGEGCALHLAALADDESPLDWKPSVCWQLPLKVDWAPDDPDDPANTTEVATVRRWTRADWGDDGDPMAWCCTEGERAYVGTERVIDSLAEPLEGIVGHEVFVELQRRLDVP